MAKKKLSKGQKARHQAAKSLLGDGFQLPKDLIHEAIGYVSPADELAALRAEVAQLKAQLAGAPDPTAAISPVNTDALPVARPGTMRLHLRVRHILGDLNFGPGVVTVPREIGQQLLEGEQRAYWEEARFADKEPPARLIVRGSGPGRQTRVAYLPGPDIAAEGIAQAGLYAFSPRDGL